MTPAPPGAGEAIRRRAVVVSAEEGRLALRWTESQCRGCVGCGGRCGLFAADDAGVVRLEHDAEALQPGDAVDVEVSAPRLRHAAMRARIGARSTVPALSTTSDSAVSPTQVPL